MVITTLATGNRRNRPSLFFEDGRAYYCTNEALTSREAISLEEINITTGRVIGQRKEIWSGTGAHFLEAPHVYHIGDWYYLLVAEGGTFFTHRTSIARSRQLFGPYEGCPHNPILTNMCDTAWQVQCSGHADFIEDTQGNCWAVHLGIRLARRTMTHLGRETFLTPFSWVDGWPVFAHEQKAVLQEDGPLLSPQQPSAPFVADLTRNNWEPEWIFLRRPDMSHLRRIPGSMLLTPTTQTLRDPIATFAAIRPLDFDCVTDACFTFSPAHPGDEAGLAIRLEKQYHITCTLGYARTLTLTLQAEDIQHVVAQTTLPTNNVQLRIVSDHEQYRFLYRTEDGSFALLGHISTRFLATEFAGHCFTGTVIGLYATCVQPNPADMRVTHFSHYVQQASES